MPFNGHYTNTFNADDASLKQRKPLKYVIIQILMYLSINAGNASSMEQWKKQPTGNILSVTMDVTCNTDMDIINISLMMVLVPTDLLRALAPIHQPSNPVCLSPVLNGILGSRGQMFSSKVLIERMITIF